MRAIVVDAEQRLDWVDVPDVAVGPGEILIDNRATAVNRADLLQRAGHYPPPPGWPEWLGLECAGLVAHAPQRCRWKVGDAVCALLGGGGYAERVAVHADLALPVPHGLSPEEAASLPEVWATAWLNLCHEAGFQRGETVFVQAGASGVGTAAIQLVKHLGGQVITTVGTAEKAELAASLGADVVLNHTTDDVAAALRDYPVDIALDCVGGPALADLLPTMRPGGRWVLIATLGGSRAELPLGAVLRGGLRLIGSTLRNRPREVKAQVLAELEASVWPAIEAGTIRPVVHATLPIVDAEEAHAILERRENLGKVVLAVDRWF